MPSLSARSMTWGVAERAARRMGSYLGRVQSPRMTRSGFWDCHQLGLRTSGAEGQRTGSSGIFDVGFLIFDKGSTAGWTTRRASWPRSRKALVRRPRSRCQKSWSRRIVRSVYSRIFKVKD